MSTNKVENAYLRCDGGKGPLYNGPFFPDDIDQLNHLWDKSDFVSTGDSIAKLGSRIPFYAETFRPTTSDEYMWFWAMRFVFSSAEEVAILVPWSQDWDEHNGTTMDRSIAFYTRNDATEEQCLAILRHLVEKIQNAANLPRNKTWEVPSERTVRNRLQESGATNVDATTLREFYAEVIRQSQGRTYVAEGIVNLFTNSILEFCSRTGLTIQGRLLMQVQTWIGALVDDEVVATEAKAQFGEMMATAVISTHSTEEVAP